MKETLAEWLKQALYVILILIEVLLVYNVYVFFFYRRLRRPKELLPAFHRYREDILKTGEHENLQEVDFIIAALSNGVRPGEVDYYVIEPQTKLFLGLKNFRFGVYVDTENTVVGRRSGVVPPAP